MSSSSSPRLNEDQLRALTRKEIQALAKKENIKPANSSTDKLIKRLLDKFYPTAPKVSASRSCTNPESKPITPSASPRQQRRSARLATAEDLNPLPAAPLTASTFSVPIERVRTTDPVPAINPVRIFSVAGSTHESSTSHLSIAGFPLTVAGSSMPPGHAGIKAATAPDTTDPVSIQAPAPGTKTPLPIPPPQFPGPTTQSVKIDFRPPGPPTQPSAYPSIKLLETYQCRVANLHEEFAEIPGFFSTMERMLPNVERTAISVSQAVKTFVWDGYYVEREIVSKMKQEQTLWDGSNVMPPGPKRDAWFTFLEAGAKHYHGLQNVEIAADVANFDWSASDSDAMTTGSSSTRQKRQRETESGTVDETKPLKRRKDRGSIEF
ncbi:hypothetical protein C8R44DRAFT_851951 [Mycena epipterygia]|nr:hypothetical protein C8R44DRAFT_851951 [Mycena epipterygia]